MIVNASFWFCMLKQVPLMEHTNSSYSISSKITKNPNIKGLKTLYKFVKSEKL